MSPQRLSETDIANVRRAADLHQIVSEQVTLRRSGSRWNGLCPFHDERTPSFYVTPGPDGSFYHCFGCDETGDVFDFVRKTDGLSFPEAVQALAQRFNVSVTYVEDDADKQARDQRRRLLDINDAAARFFVDQMASDQAAPAREELRARNFDVAEAVQRFGCGYAPMSQPSLLAHLRDNGFTADEAVTAGLATRFSDGRLRERFRGRLLWPIRDTFGRTVGFGARRILPDDPLEAKYINTAETPVYRKSEVLFGIDLARREIARLKRVYVVEGYTDVMAFHLAEMPNTVATCGTALTSEHLLTLRRAVGPDGEIVSAFDDDKAGIKAAKGFYSLAQSAVHRLSALPSAGGGLDPEHYRRTNGDDALRALAEARTPLFEQILSATLRSQPIQTPEDRRVALDVVTPLLATVRDPLLRSSYVKDVAHALAFDEGDVTRQVRPLLNDSSSEPPQPDALSTQPAPGGTLERDILHVLIQDRLLAETQAATIAPMLQQSASRRVMQAVLTALSKPSSRPWPLRVVDSSTEDNRRLVSALAGLPLPVSADRLEDYAGEIIDTLVERAEMERQREHLRSISASTDKAAKEAALRALLDGGGAS